MATESCADGGGDGGASGPCASAPVVGFSQSATSSPSLFKSALLSSLGTQRNLLFYGPQGPYSLFAGRDATRALALMSFDPNDLTGDLEGLNPDELEVLQDWEDKFKERYPRVGHLASENATHSNQNGAQLDHEEENA